VRNSGRTRAFIRHRIDEGDFHIVSLGDLACEPEADEHSKEALQGISQPV